MIRRLLGHLGRQPVAFVALFFALGGTGLAATKYLTASDPITQGDLAGSTYGDPVIASSAVTNGKLANASLSVNAGTALTGGGSVALGSSTTLGVVAGGIGTTQLADGAVTTSKFASGAQAPDSAKLAGANPSDYGAVLSGRINGLGTSVGYPDFGAPSGTSTASSSETNVSTLSPNHDLVARDFSVQLTAAPGGLAERAFFFYVNGSLVEPPCYVPAGATTCTLSGPIAVPANSTLSIADYPGGELPPAAADARFGFRLTNS